MKDKLTILWPHTPPIRSTQLLRTGRGGEYMYDNGVMTSLTYRNTRTRTHAQGTEHTTAINLLPKKLIMNCVEMAMIDVLADVPLAVSVIVWWVAAPQK